MVLTKHTWMLERKKILITAVFHSCRCNYIWKHERKLKYFCGFITLISHSTKTWSPKWALRVENIVETFRWQEYTEELYKKDLHNPGNHDAVITHLEPDILECEVKWALGSITMNKASGGDGIPAELFQILKDESWKCCTQYTSKFGKLSNGHRTGKGQFSFHPKERQCQRMLKLLHSCTHLTC